VVEGFKEARGFFARNDHGPLGLPPRSVEALARTVVDAEVPPAEWVARTAERFPDLNVVVAPHDDDRRLLWLREGHPLEGPRRPPVGTPRPHLDALLLGSAVNLRWLADPTRDPVPELAASGLGVRTGERVLRVEFTERRL
jgi:hypothetical protein